MKKILLILTFLATVMVGQSQITISQNDMPKVGDTIRLSNSLLTSFDGSLTGFNYTWDFSDLVSFTQQVDTYVSVTSTPWTYQIFFLLSASIAKYNPMPDSVAFLYPEDFYDFLKKSSTKYQYAGFGATLNSIPLPIAYNNPDVQYRFPMNYGNQDSCNFDYAIDIPGLFYYGESKKRVNEVDGWGMLSTPFGSFSTLRVKSKITGSDSLAVDTLGGGFSIPLPTSYEYKWLTNGMSVPLLQINTSVIASIEIVTSVQYRDSFRTAISVPEDIAAADPGLFVFPSPAVDQLNVNFTNPTDGESVLFLTAVDGKTIESYVPGSGLTEYTMNVSSLKSGFYLLKYLSKSGIKSARVLITH